MSGPSGAVTASHDGGVATGSTAEPQTVVAGPASQSEEGSDEPAVDPGAADAATTSAAVPTGALLTIPSWFG